MMLALAAETPVWYGPATATFQIQFAGDPLDVTRNDVKVRFLGDKSQREERTAFFDPALGSWRAILFSKEPGSYRPVLIRNGQEVEVEPKEGIVDLARTDAGLLPAKGARPDRWTLDTGDPWIGYGADLGDSPTAAQVIAVANAGATWVRVGLPADEPNDAWNEALETIERRGLTYTLALPKGCSVGWRRYAVARFGASPYLVQWDGGDEMADPWARAGSSTAVGWQGFFQNQPGPFLVPMGETGRLKALRAVIEASDWADWQAPKVWKGAAGNGVGERDRLVAVVSSGKLTNLPIADGAYDVTVADPGTGAVAKEEGKVVGSAITLQIPAERFVVLRLRR